MIKIFRKIRYDLMEKNKTGKYFKYAIGEIILVVIGILIALQINNWNENKKTENKRQDYYNQLLDDLNKDIEFANIIIKAFNADKQAYQEYFKIYSVDNVELLEIFNTIRELNLSSKPLSFNSSTTESLQNSGDIGLIPSHIRNRLIDLRRSQNLAIKRADYLDKGKNEVIQKASLLLGSMALQEQLKNIPHLKTQLGHDGRLGEIIKSFESTHVWKNLSEEATVDRLKQMQKDIEAIIGLINKEVKA